MHSDFMRSGKCDSVNARVPRKIVADGTAAAVHDVERSLWQLRFAKDFGEHRTGHQRAFCRFEDDGVSGEQRSAAHSGGKRHRKIEGRDHCENTVWSKNVQRGFVRRKLTKRTDKAVALLDLIGVVIDEI